MVMLRALQRPPTGKSPPVVPDGGQVIATVPVNMPLGVTVIGIVIVSGVVPAVAVIVPLPPDTVKLPWLVTVKVMPLLATPPTVTTTLPGVAPVATGTMMLLALHVVGVATVP